MKKAIKNLFYDTAHACGLTALARFKNRACVPVLIYHGVTESDRDDALDVERIHITTAGLRRHLEYITDRYKVVSMRRYVDALRGGPALEPNSLVLTFDDGYENNYTAAFPLLKEFRVPATVYIPTEFVAKRQPLWTDRLKCVFRSTQRHEWTDSSGAIFRFGTLEDRAAAYLHTKNSLKQLDGTAHGKALERIEEELLDGGQIKLNPLFTPLTRDQIREMVESTLIEIGSHGCRHRLLSTLDSGEAAGELKNSQRIVSELSGTKTTAFSYPNGDFDHEIMKAAEDAGYTSAVAGGLCLNRPHDTSLFAIARVALGEDDSEAMIAATLCGIRERLLTWQGHPQIEHFKRYG